MTTIPDLSTVAPTSPDLNALASHAVDRERDLACDHLAALYAQGILSRDEFDRRLLLTLAGQSRAEMARGLVGLTGSLAATQLPPLPPPVAQFTGEALPGAGEPSRPACLLAVHDGSLILLMTLAFLGLMGVSILTLVTTTQVVGVVLWLGALAGAVLGGGALQLWSRRRAERP